MEKQHQELGGHGDVIDDSICVFSTTNSWTFESADL
jgi:hypothetical protein